MTEIIVVSHLGSVRAAELNNGKGAVMRSRPEIGRHPSKPVFSNVIEIINQRSHG